MTVFLLVCSDSDKNGPMDGQNNLSDIAITSNFGGPHLQNDLSEAKHRWLWLLFSHFICSETLCVQTIISHLIKLMLNILMPIFDTNSCFQCIILKISSKPIINMQTKYSEFHSQTLGITELIKKILMDIWISNTIASSN